jgi:hypothetical protein
VCRGRSNACNPLAPRIDKNLGNPVVKRCGVRTLADHRGIRLLSVNRGGVVSWKSCKQTILTRSTMEAELAALDTATVEIE